MRAWAPTPPIFVAPASMARWMKACGLNSRSKLPAHPATSGLTTPASWVDAWNIGQSTCWTSSA